MGLELKITKEFVDLTDAMTAEFKTKSYAAENMNYLLMKVPVSNTSTIQMVQGKFTDTQNYQAGIARVIAAPRLLNLETDAKAKEGDYVVYSHAAKYTVSPLVVKLLFGLELSESRPLDFVEENNQQPVITITDQDILLTLPTDSIKVKE